MSMEAQRLMTVSELVVVFKNLGLTSGDTVMVHSSLSGLGYLPNGPYDVIDALINVVGSSGNIVVPTHTGQLTDPDQWSDPPVPKEWVERIRESMLVFDKRKTMPRGRGRLPEYFLRYENVKRSAHPLNSVAAIGPLADFLTENHQFQEPEGKRSPMHRLDNNRGKILLLGVGMEKCTAFHLAEYLVDCDYLKHNQTRVLCRTEHGGKAYVRLDKYPSISSGFEKLRDSLRDKGYLHEKYIDDYRTTLISLKPAVDLLIERLTIDPKAAH